MKTREVFLVLNGEGEVDYECRPCRAREDAQFELEFYFGKDHPRARVARFVPAPEEEKG